MRYLVAKQLFKKFVDGGKNCNRSTVFNITVVILLVKRHPYTPFPLLGPIAGLYAYIEDVC